jgi:hypothetical protein
MPFVIAGLVPAISMSWRRGARRIGMAATNPAMTGLIVTMDSGLGAGRRAPQ